MRDAVRGHRETSVETCFNFLQLSGQEIQAHEARSVDNWHISDYGVVIIHTGWRQLIIRPCPHSRA